MKTPSIEQIGKCFHIFSVLPWYKMFVYYTIHYIIPNIFLWAKIYSVILSIFSASVSKRVIANPFILVSIATCWLLITNTPTKFNQFRYGRDGSCLLVNMIRFCRSKERNGITKLEFWFDISSNILMHFSVKFIFGRQTYPTISP